MYSNSRVNSRYHLEVLCIIKKLETRRFISMLHNQVAAILLLFAVISGKKSRKFAMDSSVTVFVQHGRKIKYRGATALKKNFIK